MNREFRAWTKSRKYVRDWLIHLHSRLTFLSFQPGSIYFISIFLYCLLPLHPIKICTNFSSFSLCFLTCSALITLSVALYSLLFTLFSDSSSLSVYVHHSWRRLRQRKGSVVCPVGWQAPAEPRGSLFVRKWFSWCWGGHSKSSPAISVMALRRCCLCPVMVTDDWLGRRGPSRRVAKGRTNLHAHTHVHTQTLA